MEKEALCALPHGAHLFIAFSISFNLISLYIFPHWVRHESIPTIKITIAVLCQVHDACRTLTGSPSGLIIASWFEKTHSHFTFFFFFFPVTFEHACDVHTKKNTMITAGLLVRICTHMNLAHMLILLSVHMKPDEMDTHTHTHCDVCVCVLRLCIP